MTREFTNRTYLLRQYRDGSNLNARIALHERFSTNPHGFFRWYFDQLDLFAEVPVLEVGCGTGQVWLENRDRVPTGWRITLTDLSRGMLTEAEEALAGVPGNFEFRIADVQDLPFPDASFHLVMANFMLYHVPDRQRAVAEVRRALVPGGRFYAATLGHRHMLQLEEALHLLNPALAHLEEPNFSLERGRDELMEWFDHVELLRYDDGLAVTEVEPLVAYVASGRMGSGFMGETERRFREWAEEEIQRNGAVKIDKEAGLFLAW